MCDLRGFLTLKLDRGDQAKACFMEVDQFLGGITTKRRRKDKVVALAQHESPDSPPGASAPAPPIPVPYNNLRRSNYDDTLLSSSS